MYPNGVFVQWSVNSPEFGTFLTDVYRSSTAAGPWELLVSAAENIYNLNDQFLTTNPDAVTEVANQLSITRALYYRVVVTAPSLLVAEAQAAVEPGLAPRMKLIKRKMLRDEAVTYRRLSGTEICVLKRKRWGARCPDCYDPITKEVLRADCTTCYGTSFTGGYFDPVRTYGRRTVVQRDVGVTSLGVTETAVAQLWVLDAPYLEVDDIVVFLGDNRRFLITKWHNTELRTVTVHQKVDMTEIPRSGIEYRITVDPHRVPPLF